MDSFLARRSEGSIPTNLVALRSICCRGQPDTHFCRAHLVKFCSVCALKHLKDRGHDCDAGNIIEIGKFDTYTQEVRQRAQLFQ